jgi:hypothetical protein
MPTVPIDPSVDLSANPMGRFAAPDVAAPAIQQGPDYTGKQIEQAGAAMVNAGSTFMRIAERIQDDVDDTVTKQADNFVAEKIREKQTKYLLTKNQDAVNGYAAVDEELTKIVKDTADGLENEMQRKMFGQVAQRRLLAARAEMGAHQLKQLKEWKFNETKSRVDNLMNDAVADADKWSVPNSLYQQRKTAMLAEIDDLAQQAGIVNADGEVDRGSEQYKSLVRNVNTKLHETVVNQFVAEERPKMAAAYLKNYKGEIERDKLDNLTTFVKKAEETVNVKEDSLRLQLDMSKVPFDQALSKVNKMFQDGEISAELRDATVTRLEHQNQIAKQAEAKMNANMLGEAQEWMIRHPGASVLSMPAKYQQWARETGHWNSLKSLEKTGGEFKTNMNVWGKILTMPADELAKMSSDEFIAKYRGSLDNSDLERGLAMLGAAKGKEIKAENKPELTVFETNTEIVKRAAQENKILPYTGSPNEKQQKDFALFEKQIQKYVNEYEITQLGGKRKANTDEVKKITSQVLLDKVRIDEWGRDPEIPSYQITPENAKQAYVDVKGKQVYLAQIPATDRERIVAGLKQRNLPVTQQAIAEIWLQANRR